MAADHVPDGIRGPMIDALKQLHFEACATHAISTDACAAPGVALVGDAGGCSHPLTASGMTNAMNDLMTLSELCARSHSSATRRSGPASGTSRAEGSGKSRSNVRITREIPLGRAQRLRFVMTRDPARESATVMLGPEIADREDIREQVKTFETAGSPVAYLDAPEFAKFVADDSARLIAAVKKIGKVE